MGLTFEQRIFAIKHYFSNKLYCAMKFFQMTVLNKTVVDSLIRSVHDTGSVC